MTTSFFNGISGLKSFQNGIDVWGNNISNINLSAYKEKIPEFGALFSNTISNSVITSDVGEGSTLDANSLNLSQGNLINTDNQFDIALDKNGWLPVKKGDETYYTRNGSFTKNKDGFLVDSNGDYLLVANANNIKNNNGEYEIDQNIPTDNLINNPLSPISLPNSITLPAVATTKIDFFTNLNDAQTIDSTTYADTNSDFSALYSKDGENLNVRNGNSFVFGFGNDATYSNNLISTEICVNDDKVDGEDVVYDFTINNKQINFTLPDGSTKEEIQNTLVDKLKQNDIDAKTSNNGIIISDPQKIIIQSNNENMPNMAAEKLSYNQNPANENEFNTIQSLIDKLQTLATDVNSNLSISLNNKGQIVTTNNSDETTHSYLLNTESSNQLLNDNLSSLGKDIYKQTSAQSNSFKTNEQVFGGNIYEANGNKDLITFSFTKQKVLENQIEWNGVITVKDPNGNVINSVNNTFTFNDKGSLISPTTLTLSSPQNIDINLKDLTSYSKSNSNGYSFSQNGIAKGYLKEYNIVDDGTIYADFSNTKSVALGQIPVFHFQNPQGLESIGNSLFRETANSNKAFLYEKDGTYLPGSKIHSYTIETSNVNFTQAMTELIVNQKAYSAAAKTITTSDQMIQKAINMKR